MAALVWDKTGERRIETGVDHCALYVYDPAQKTYGKGVAWNGITAISEKPEGAEATDLYADNILYLSMLSAEKLKATIEAYTYPDEFEQCDGSATLTKGVKIGQQDRLAFGLVYRTKIGDDVAGQDKGYKLHVLYGCKASPSEKGYKTVNDSTRGDLLLLGALHDPCHGEWRQADLAADHLVPRRRRHQAEGPRGQAVRIRRRSGWSSGYRAQAPST